MKFIFDMSDPEFIEVLKKEGLAVKYDLNCHRPWFSFKDISEFEGFLTRHFTDNGVVIQLAKNYEPGFNGHYISQNYK